MYGGPQPHLPVWVVMLAKDAHQRPAVRVLERGQLLIEVLPHRRHVALHCCHTTELLVYPQAMPQRNEVQEGERPMLVPVGGLLEVMPVQVGSGKEHTAAAPVGLQGRTSIELAQCQAPRGWGTQCTS